MFLPFCPIVVRLILGFSADSLVTYWGVAHVCVRTECSVRWVILSWIAVQRYEEKQSVVPLFPRLVTNFPTACYISLCISWLQSQKMEYKSWWLSYIAEYKEDRWSTILLLAWSCGRVMGAMLGAVKKRAENGIFQWNAKNGVTALQLTVDSFDKPKIENPSQNFIYIIYIYLYIYIYI